MSNEAGKGDVPRPFSVTPEVYDANWERTFGVLANDWPRCEDCGKPMLFDDDAPTVGCCYTVEWGNNRPKNWLERQQAYLRKLRGKKTFIENCDPGDETDQK